MEASSPSRCLNCDSPLADPYCSRCGQEAEGPPLAAIPLLGHVLSRATGKNALRTLTNLLFKPGRLTAEYVEGRRVRYSGPVQVYLWCTAAFFLVHAYLPFVEIDFAEERAVSNLSALSVTTTLPEGLVGQISAQGMTEELFAERFHAVVSGYFPVFLIALVAGSAILFSGLFRKRPFLTHAVFALHWTAFFFTLEAIIRLLRLPDSFSSFTPLVLLVYLAIAMRVVYGQGWIASGLKALVGLLAFVLILTAWLGSTSLVASLLA